MCVPVCVHAGMPVSITHCLSAAWSQTENNSSGFCPDYSKASDFSASLEGTQWLVTPKTREEAVRQLMQQRSWNESEHRIRETFGLKDLTNKARCLLHASPNIVIEAALNRGNYCFKWANVSFQQHSCITKTQLVLTAK